MQFLYYGVAITTVGILSGIGYLYYHSYKVNQIYKESVKRYRETKNIQEFYPFIELCIQKDWLKDGLKNQLEKKIGEDQDKEINLYSFQLIKLAQKFENNEDNDYLVLKDLIVQIFVVEISKLELDQKEIIIKKIIKNVIYKNDVIFNNIVAEKNLMEQKLWNDVTQNEELARQDEEVVQQDEELAQQDEELAQHKELAQQDKELAEELALAANNAEINKQVWMVEEITNED